MSRLLVIVCALLLWQQAEAQPAFQDDFVNRVRQMQGPPPRISKSGQFAVFEAPPVVWRPPDLDSAVHTNYVQLAPELLVITCDRIKAAVLQDLGARDQWQGTVRVYLHITRNPDEPIVSPTPNDRTRYYLYLPDKVERTRLVSAIVAVLLEEMANRTAEERPAEIPTWLVEGLTREVMQEHPYDLIASPPSFADRFNGQVYQVTNTPPLLRAREVLRVRSPLTLDELSWPSPGQEEDDAYRSSAQLLVCDLLQLNDGRQSMQSFIPMLSRHLNWQLSFMDAFHADFDSRLELAKWWALCVVRFTGRDLAENLNSEDSWRRLDDLLRAKAEVRTSADQLPSHTELKLQDVIAGWTPAMQEATLKNAVNYLAALRPSVSDEVAPLVDSYEQALSLYVKERDKSGLFRNKKKSLRVIGLDKPALLTIQRLDALDARRQQLEAGIPSQDARTTAVNH